MAINYEDLLARQEEARAEFGRVLREWRTMNYWSVWDPARLAESKGFSPVPYGLWADLEAGTHGNLSPMVFIGLAILNEQPGIVAIGSAEYQNLLWGPTDFWALYCGLQTTPWAWRYP
jgi:hypothetical protein